MWIYLEWFDRGVGYPDLWPSPQCTEPLDVSNQFTFDVIEGIIRGLLLFLALLFLRSTVIPVLYELYGKGRTTILNSKSLYSYRGKIDLSHNMKSSSSTNETLEVESAGMYYG